jgi:hypothetical protein
MLMKTHEQRINRRVRGTRNAGRIVADASVYQEFMAVATPFLQNA